MKKNILLYTLFLILSYTNAQDKQAYLDSIKASFINDETSSCIDERWMKELTNQDLFENMQKDIVEVDIDQTVNYDLLSTDLLKKRLKKMDEASVFNINYHPALENVIKSFLKNRSKSYERLMAISEYYFPLFEEHLAKYNVPLEIKYLAIVESALNPRARSRVGASGLWQFMLATGKQYNLEVNSYVDERFDPIKASEAAARYLSDLHGMLGDWDLVLAAYNSGPANVSKAIRRSGGQANYWNIRNNLPRETQGYLPAFLATMYVYEYHKEHNIAPRKANITYFETDTIMVKRKMTFKQISQLLDIPVEQIQFLNPIYKLDIVPYMTDKPHYLRLPKNKIGVFASNENKIYAYLDFEENLREKPIFAAARDSISVDEPRIITRYIYHKVRSGETLSKIANKYNVSVSELKKWNRIKGGSVKKGRTLKIQTQKTIYPTAPKEIIIEAQNTPDTSITTTQATETESETGCIYHTVKKKETLSSIARKYNQSMDNIRMWNKISGNSLKTGTKLKIFTQTPTENQPEIETPKVQITHKVKQGEYLAKIAEKYKVTVAEILEWNQLSNPEVKAGTVLVIKQSLQETNIIPQQTTESILHQVKKGESLGRIASEYDVTVGQIMEWNNLPDNNIGEGQTLIIKPENPKAQSVTKTKAKPKNKTYIVKSGDTLSEIADKHNVTVADLKKWNQIKGSSIQKGMKIVIKH